jgi:hypothetical protein
MVEEEQAEEDVMIDLSLYCPGPEIHDLIGSFALQSGNSTRYFMHKFPKLVRLILQKKTYKENFQATKLSEEIMMQFLNYITTIPAKVEINNIYMKSSARDFLISFVNLYDFKSVFSISYADRIRSDPFGRFFGARENQPQEERIDVKKRRKVETDMTATWKA